MSDKRTFIEWLQFCRQNKSKLTQLYSIEFRKWSELQDKITIGFISQPKPSEFMGITPYVYKNDSYHSI